MCHLCVIKELENQRKRKENEEEEKKKKCRE